MNKLCLSCSSLYSVDNFPKNGKTKYGTIQRKSLCKYCYNKKQNNKRIKKPKILKYKNEEERIIAARNRSKLWYKENKSKAKERISSWQKSEHGKQKRKKLRDLWKIKHPFKYRAKIKKDKCIRRSREKNIKSLELSSLIILENYNIKTFNYEIFCCEYCKNKIEGVYHLDHIVPLCKDGTNDLANLAISCAKCNLKKGSKLLVDFDQLNYFKFRKLI